MGIYLVDSDVKSTSFLFILRLIVDWVPVSADELWFAGRGYATAGRLNRPLCIRVVCWSCCNTLSLARRASRHPLYFKQQQQSRMGGRM